MKDGRRSKRHAVRNLFTAIFFENIQNIDDVKNTANARHVRILDISETGAALYIEEQLTQGSRHVIEFHSDEGKTIRTPAIVSWTKFMDKHSGHSVGLQFVDIAERHERRLVSGLAFVQQASES